MSFESKNVYNYTGNKIGRLELQQTGQDGICKLVDSLVNAVYILDKTNSDSALATKKLNEVLSAIDFKVED